MANREIPRSLSVWFVIHCVADVVVALPLLVAPEWFLTLLGWEVVDPIASRIVAAALFGIGIESYLGRNGSIESFTGMLNLKIVWSLAAIVGFLVSIAQGIRPWGIYPFLAIFVAFNVLWVYWRRRIGRQQP